MNILISRLKPYFKPYVRTVVIGLFFVVMANAFKVLLPMILRNAINGLEDGFTHAQLWQQGYLILGLSFVAAIFRYLMRKTVIGVSRHIEYDIRLDLFTHLMKLEPAYYDHSRVGDLMARSTSDIEQVRMMLGPALMYSTNTIFGLTFGMTLMLMINVPMSLIVSLIVPFVVAAVFLLGKRIHAASSASQEAYSNLTNVTQENLAGIRVVKSFRQESAQEGLFEEKNQDYFKKSFKVGLIQGIFFPAIMMIFGLSIAGILLCSTLYNSI